MYHLPIRNNIKFDTGKAPKQEREILGHFKQFLYTETSWFATARELQVL